MNSETIFLLILIGLAAGTLSGLVGVGGGIIIVPALVFFLDSHNKRPRELRLDCFYSPQVFWLLSIITTRALSI